MSFASLNLVQGATGQGQERISYGEVAQHKPAPASFTDPLYVVKPDWDPELFWKITNWPRIHGNTLPAHGAACLLIEDSRGNLRCPWWDGVNS